MCLLGRKRGTTLWTFSLKKRTDFVHLPLDFQMMEKKLLYRKFPWACRNMKILLSQCFVTVIVIGCTCTCTNSSQWSPYCCKFLNHSFPLHPFPAVLVTAIFMSTIETSVKEHYRYTVGIIRSMLLVSYSSSHLCCLNQMHGRSLWSLRIYKGWKCLSL